MPSFEERVLVRAKMLNFVERGLRRRRDRHEISPKSYLEALLRAEAKFVESVAALRQKEDGDGTRSR